MAEAQTLARPYARAAFAQARDEGAVEAWSQALTRLALALALAEAEALVGDPRLTRAQRAAVFVDVLGGDAPQTAKNLVRLLADNHRLPLAPAIAHAFERLRAEAEGRLQVVITSALPVAESQRQRLAEALRRRLTATLDLVWREDPRLIGGALIRAGDLVIDGSLRGQLQRLRNQLAV
ncbi:MAG: F0F1 ATP synthase subunit delta [Gammaproteobacteria bacterium]|nr:F0F1 ATP synthase subunit delta [Gammaproteobacteria bacterium]